MSTVSQWMGVSDDPCLYKSEFYGMQYWGPSSQKGTKITGFDTSTIDRPVGKLLGKRDIKIFETLFWPISNAYGYTEISQKQFREQLKEIEPWVHEPLEFELEIYNKLQD